MFLEFVLCHILKLCKGINLRKLGFFCHCLLATYKGCISVPLYFMLRQWLLENGWILEIGHPQVPLTSLFLMKNFYDPETAIFFSKIDQRDREEDIKS